MCHSFQLCLDVLSNRSGYSIIDNCKAGFLGAASTQYPRPSISFAVSALVLQVLLISVLVRKQCKQCDQQRGGCQRVFRPNVSHDEGAL